MKPDPDMTTTALAGWYGSARMIAEDVGKALAGCTHVTIPFVGGFSEVPWINARSIVVADQHRHIINCAMVTADPILGPKLYRAARRLPLHEDVLAAAQHRCRARECQAVATAGLFGEARPVPMMPDLDWAIDYWVCCWMGRGGSAGTPGEFRGGLSVRMDDGGGDSAARYASATRSQMAWRRTLRRCSCLCCDAFELLPTVKDQVGCGLYVDSPWAGAPGEKYSNPFGESQHRRLATALSRFKHTRVVVRYGIHPLIEELYPRDRWTWSIRAGRDRANQEKAEALIVRRAA